MSREILSRPPIPAAHRIPYGPDASQFFDIFSSKPQTSGLAIMIHGGFWRSQFDLTHASHLCSALAAAGLTVASLEYRRVGSTGGGWPVTFQDVVAGFHAIRHHFAEATQPIVLGHSAGGHLALRLASETPAIKAVVALAAVSCLDLADEQNLGNGAVRDFLGGSLQQVPAIYHAADPSHRESAVPFIAIHGDHDDVVPHSFSSTYLARRRRDLPQNKLIELPYADHFDLIDPDSKAWPSVLEAVRSA